VPSLEVRFDARVEAEDATRRTRLASERTFLAWWRTGLTSLAVGLAAGRLVPELAGGESWPYVLLGVAYSLLGLAFIVYGLRRQFEVEDAVRRGDWASLDPRIALALTLAGAVLGLGTIAVVIFAS
jgi:putative membrane protein